MTQIVKYTRNGSAPLPVLQPRPPNLYLGSTFVVDGDQRRKRRVAITNIAAFWSGNTAPTAICIPSITDVGP